MISDRIIIFLSIYVSDRLVPIVLPSRSISCPAYFFCHSFFCCNRFYGQWAFDPTAKILVIDSRPVLALCPPPLSSASLFVRLVYYVQDGRG